MLTRRPGAALRSARRVGRVLLAAAIGCAGPVMLAEDGMLRHRTHGFQVPDLVAAGWTATAVPGADAAFRKPGQGVIALRSTCGARAPTARARIRSLWYQIDAPAAETHERQLGSYLAVERTAELDGLVARTLVVRTEHCAIEFAQVGPLGSDGRTLDEFAAGLRTEPSP